MKIIIKKNIGCDMSKKLSFNQRETYITNDSKDQTLCSQDREDALRLHTQRESIKRPIFKTLPKTGYSKLYTKMINNLTLIKSENKYSILII